ncbi:MAG: ChbG/HpnK family deacetylase [Candidatus Omnitrophota bacterium]
MQKKQLIINADDVGLSGAINAAVKTCYEKEAITGVSVMADGRCFKEAASMLRELGKPEVGIHLAYPVPGGVRNFAALYFSGGLDLADVYQMFSRQIKKARNAGLEITHMDSHEHIHMFPAVLKILAALAVEFKIPYIRLSLEKGSVLRKRFNAKDILRHMALKPFALLGKRFLSREGIKHNDAFWGHFHAGRINDDVLCFIMRNLVPGVNELAVHPGIMSPELLKDSPWHKNAQQETTALLEGKWRALAAVADIRLVTHKEVVG